MKSAKIASIQTELIAYFYEEGRTSFKLPEDSYESWAMLLCEQGKFKYQIGEDHGMVKVGELILCPPGHALIRQVTTTLSFHFATFNLRVRNRHGDEIRFPFYGKHSCRNSMRLMYTMEQLRGAKHNISKHYTEHLVNDILYQMVDERISLQQEEKPEDPDILEAIRYLNEHAFLGISLTEAAQHVGLSSSQFTRKFQKVMAVSPSKYLTRLRLQKVCSLLIESDETLEKIAESTGYQNAFYLSRVFSREIGMSPSQYRQLHRV